MTLLQLVGSSSLALETFPEQKRRAVWKIAGDVREHGADLLRKTWEAIGWDTTPEERAGTASSKMGGYQVQYVPTLVRADRRALPQRPRGPTQDGCRGLADDDR